MTSPRRVVLQPSYGSPDVLSLTTAPTPDLEPHHVLLRVRHVSLSRADLHLLTGTPYLLRLAYGLRKPSNPTPGQDLAGEVLALGPHVEHLSPGDLVFGTLPRGALADTVLAPTSSLTPLPPNVPSAHAAAAPTSGLAALQGLRDVARLQPHQRVLILGASGGVGTFAIQVAKHLGAHVTAVCSTPNLDRARTLGADDVVDYRTQPLPSPTPFDVIFDVVGAYPLPTLEPLLTPRGTYVSAGSLHDGPWLSALTRLLALRLRSLRTPRTFTHLLSTPTPQDLRVLSDLLADGTLTPTIEHTLPLEDTPHAFELLARGHARGKLVIEL